MFADAREHACLCHTQGVEPQYFVIIGLCPESSESIKERL